jgi:hypothetical protein
MSQQQESCLPQLRELAAKLGYPDAIKQAAATIDGLTDEIGRTRDMNFTVMLTALLWGAACGFGIGWLVFA